MLCYDCTYFLTEDEKSRALEGNTLKLLLRLKIKHTFTLKFVFCSLDKLLSVEMNPDISVVDNT
jgi:hypothetical protein